VERPSAICYHHAIGRKAIILLRSRDLGIMTSPQHSATQVSPGPEGATIPLPRAPQPAAAAAAVPPGRPSRGRVLAALVLVLAFLAASFLARNSDLWFHLATGRLVAHGKLPAFDGEDPFAYTTGLTYWACHSWLFDFALYGLYNLVGGPGLVVLKALLVTALAALLLSVRRPAGAAWVPALCTALAVLAMSPRLLLQPACASYFLLGLTLWLLWRLQADGEEGRTGPWYRYLALPVVFAVWVNVDEWFLLGPVLVALFWLGERLQGQRRTPFWVVPAGLAACLLNPYTYHAFTLPADLSPVSWTSGLRQDPRFQGQFASPWQAEYLGAAYGLNAAVLAYYALTLLGLLSFALHPRALRGWRLLVWLPFAVLAAWQARAIPFFAVVAAPVTALNVQDFLASRRVRAGAGGPGLADLAVRGALALCLLALIGLAWPGWLAGRGRQDRHVAWDVQPDPSLRQVTETLNAWRRRPLMPSGEFVFALSPEVAQYAAWFCPDDRHFFDHRYSLFPQAARDYETVCRYLLPDLAPAPAGKASYAPSRGHGKDWRQVLRDNRVGVVVLHDREPGRLLAAVQHLASDPQEWTLLAVSGQAVIFGWNPARPPGAFAPLAFDADRLAFGPQDERAERAAPLAPDQGPELLPPVRDFRDRARELWGQVVSPPTPPSWESAAATVDLEYANDTEAGQRERHWRSLLRTYAAGLTGLPAQPAAAPQAAFQVWASRDLLFPRDEQARFLVREQIGPFFAPLVERPPALPLLAVRAARRAVADNPADANAWLRLAQAYLLLRNGTRERTAEGMLPPLAQLRHVQIVTALEQVVRLNPDLEEAHHELALLYGPRNYLDAALEHQREELRLSRRAGPRPGESAEEFDHRLETLDKDTAKLEELVQDRRQKYAAGSRSLQGDRRAQADMALQLGLARLAVDEVLLSASAEVLGPDGIKLELDLLLTLGRAQEVRPILNDPGLRANKQALRSYDLTAPRTREGAPLYPLPYHWPAYEWLHVLEAAAVGDYGQARADLGAARAEVRTRHGLMRQRLDDVTRRSRPLVPGLLAGRPPLPPALPALSATLGEKAAFEFGDRIFRGQQADLCVLEGLLALEQGDPPAARSAFAEAQQLGAPVAGAEVPFAGRPIATGYLGQLNAQD
jgi:hypothetical protein